MGHKVFSGRDFYFRINVSHQQASESNKLLQLLWASKVQWRPVGGTRTCKTPECYSIPEWSTLVGADLCLELIQNACKTFLSCSQSSFISMCQVALSTVMKAHLKLGRDLPRAT